MPFPIAMDFGPGHGGEPVPDALHFGVASVIMEVFVDGLAEPDHYHIARHDLPSGRWELAFLGSAT